MFNVQLVNAALIPRDKEGIWVLDFAFKPLRIKTVEIPGKGRRQVHYLYYKVTNRTGKPRMFVPEFIMVNEQGQKFLDNVIPQAVPLIQAREDSTIPLLGAVNIMGIIPPSTKPDVDDAVFGVATWDKWDPKSDRFSIYVRGLSDGYKEVPTAGGGEADRQVQDAADRFHPARRRAQFEREGNLPERPAIRVGVLVNEAIPRPRSGELAARRRFRWVAPTLPGPVKRRRGSGSTSPSRSKAERRIRQESQRPQARPDGAGS